MHIDETGSEDEAVDVDAESGGLVLQVPYGDYAVPSYTDVSSTTAPAASVHDARAPQQDVQHFQSRSSTASTSISKPGSALWIVVRAG